MATTVRIPVNFRNPRFTTMASKAWWLPVGLTAHDFGRWEFLKDDDGKIYGTVIIPRNVAATPNAKIVVSLMVAATTGVTRLQVSTKAVADGESLNPASLTAETAQDITVPATARLRKDITFPAAGSLAEAVAADDELLVELYHNGLHTNDTLAVNTEISEAMLQIDVA